MLSSQLNDVKRELEANQITIDSDDDQEDEMVKEYNRLRSARRMAQSPTPSSKSSIRYPPISAKRGGQMSFLSKTKEVTKLRKMNTIERINQYPPIYEGSYDAEKGRGDSHRKQNRYGLGIRAESIDPLNVIQVKGSNYLKKLLPNKQGPRSSNSPSRPKYNQEDSIKEKTPSYGRGRPSNNKSQEGNEWTPSIPPLGVQGAGLNIKSKHQVDSSNGRVKVERIFQMLTSTATASDHRKTTVDNHITSSRIIN